MSMLKHLGIIMDGNRRFAKKHGKLPIFGHKAGFDNAVKISKIIALKDISYLTLWALSTENLEKREKEELTGIIGLIEFIPSLLPVFQENKSSFHTIWDISKLPERTQKILAEVKEKSKNFWDKKIILALVYGWQDEIIRGIKKFIKSSEDIDALTPAKFGTYLDSGDFPYPDFIIRTGAEQRHSGFLLYGSSYSEYFFSWKLWPEFDEQELEKALEFFNTTKRNFGK